MQGIRNTHSTGMCKVLVKYKDIEYNDCTALGRAMQEEHQMTFFLKLQETELEVISLRLDPFNPFTTQ